jgi:DNA-binding response OmpR family regulator
MSDPRVTFPGKNFFLRHRAVLFPLIEFYKERKTRNEALIMKVLLAEDDPRLGKLMVRMFKREQYAADWVTDGQTAYDQGVTGNYDVIVLDWMLPKTDGLQVCRSLREDHYSGAILMLTARETIEDRVSGLDSGADDYLTKPFSFDELFARIRTLSRRNFFPLNRGRIHTHDLIIDTISRSVTKNGKTIRLTAREYQLLLYLINNPNRILTKEMILSKVWEDSSEVTYNTAEVYVKLLRKKFGQSKRDSYIQTVRGAGYMWVDQRV